MTQDTMYSKMEVSYLLCIILITVPRSLGSCHKDFSQYQHTICVTTNHSLINAGECCRNAYPSFEHLNGSIGNSSVVLVDNIFLESSVSFFGLHNITLIGLNRPQTKITCNATNNTGAGLAFIGVKNLSISDLTFEHCGAFYNSTTTLVKQTKHSTFRSSIYILNSTMVFIEKVLIKNSTGNAVTFFDTDESVIVSHSSFESNAIPESEKEVYSGGGGVYVEFTYCSPNIDISQTGECDNAGQHNKDSRYDFHNCTFRNNKATILNASSTDRWINNTHEFEGLGRGGGMNIVFKGHAENNSVSVCNCTFYQNTAVWGGGLYACFRDSVHENNIFVSDSVFEGNICETAAGGGADVGYLFFNSSSSEHNKIHFNNCLFRKNQAIYGGGVAIYSSKYYRDLENVIEFTDCTWEENIARFGSAVDISPLLKWDSQSTTGFLPSPVFENSHFDSNFITPETIQADCTCKHPWMQTKESEGGFTAVGFSIRFKGKLYFGHHNGSAMYVTFCSLNFDSGTNATFIGNSGFVGGAMTLSGLSVMYVRDNSSFAFINNSASDRGGAIYVEIAQKYNLISLRICFIVYKGYLDVKERNLTFKFCGNRAGSSGRTEHRGDSIFLTSLHQCRTPYNNDSHPFSSIGTFTYSGSSSKPLQYEISTEGGHFNQNNKIHPPSVAIIPGKEFTLPFISEDDFHQNIINVYSVAIKIIANHSSTIKVDSGYSHISDDQLKLCGKPGDKGIVVLSQLGFRRTTISFEVHMQECPPGFILDNDSMKCMCPAPSDRTYSGIAECHNSTFKAYLYRGFWMGYNSTLELLSGYCPSGFCFSYESVFHSKTNLLPSVFSKEMLDDLVCGPKRTGRLCGECRDNYSAYYHDSYFKCGKKDHCNMGLLFYTISELLPLTGLFILVIIFDISFTSGGVNAFIFFAQVINSLEIQAKGFIWFPYTVHKLTNVHRFVYRLFNLDFFSSHSLAFCLWEGAKPIDVIAFKYVTVIYALMLVFITVMLMNVCNCYRFCRCIKPRTVKTSVIHGLSAFLVMCYSQCSSVSFLLLQPSYLYTRGPTYNNLVVQYSGSTAYFSRGHLLYAIPAIFCLVTIIILPTILLLMYPGYYKILTLLRLNENKKLQQLSSLIPIAKLKPLFDSFQSCYSDNFRFFSGLSFVYRLLIVALLCFSTSWIFFYAMIEVQLTLMLAIHALVQPYKKRWHNAVDILVFADLSFINGLSLYNYVYSRRGNKNLVDLASSFQLLLIYLPILCIVGYIMFYLLLQIKSCFKRNNIQEHHEENEFPGRIIYGDEESSTEEEYHDFEEYELT